MRHVRADGHADRGDVVVGGVPPAGRVASPPGQHGRGGHPPQEADRRLAVAGEDPVSVLERVHRAGLHRLVIPEDRVRADPALSVVHQGALVVGAEEDERAVEREKVVLVEPLDLGVGDGAAVADHAPEARLGKHLRHRAGESSRSERRTGRCPASRAGVLSNDSHRSQRKGEESCARVLHRRG